MGEQNHVALAVQTLTAPAHRRRAAEPPSQTLDVTVLFTSVEPTLAALRTAGELASRLNCRITVVAPQLVPYPLPLASPPVLVEFNERRFRVIAEEARVDTSVQVYLCRDRTEALLAALAPHSLIVIGMRPCWWPTADKRLASKLRRAGHEVLITETE